MARIPGLLFGLIPIATAGAQVKDIRCEVVSIKPLNGAVNLSFNTNPSPNGFDARMSLWQAINAAYGPVNSVNWSSVEILQTPNWVGEFYDIKGRVSQAGVLVQSVENGIQVNTYYGASMEDLADFLCILSGKIPVRDKTGLTGRYDFAIRSAPPLPDENHVYLYSVSHLGLKVKPGMESRPAGENACLT